MRATVASIIMEEFTPARVRSKRSTPCFSPPNRMLKPIIRSRFPRMDPMMEACTRTTLPACRATIVMISSAAFPRVAFKKPPNLGPVVSASASVACPIKPARGTIPNEQLIRMRVESQCANSATIANGTKIRR